MSFDSYLEKNWKISPGFRLQWEEAQQKNVLLYPEGMVKLNESAAEILKLCDGAHRMEEIIFLLEAQVDNIDIRDDVIDFLRGAYERHWIIPV
jgi:pyrroloquinoline quinone biosynthesis protein D